MKTNLKMFIICGVLFTAAQLMAETETVGDYKWTYRINGDTAEIGYGGSCAVSPKPSGAVTIPATLGGKTVTRIGDYAFAGCRRLTAVKMTAGITNIGSYAFMRCSGITNFTIGSSVKSIGDYSFMECTNLTNVTIPNSFASIGNNAFCGCSGLKAFNVAEGNPKYKSVSGLLLTKDGKTLVQGVNGDVVIPDGVVTIGNCAFFGYNGLTSVMLGDSVTSIWVSAFYHCSGLKAFNVTEGNPKYKSVSGLLLTKDEKTLIRGVNGDMTIPKCVTNIVMGAFYGCSRRTSMAIGDGVASIGEGALFFFGGLKAFNVSDGNPNFKSVSGLLLTKDGKTLIRGVNGDVAIPDGVVSIGDDAFRGCDGLTSVTVPSSVTRIGRTAFSCCSELTNVTMRGNRPNVPKDTNDIFQCCDKLKAIHVPANAKSWAGMKKWRGRTIVFDGDAKMNRSDFKLATASNVLAGPYGIRMHPDPGCEKGAEYVLNRLMEDYLPVAVRYYGDPFGGKTPSRVFKIVVKRNRWTEQPWWGTSSDNFIVGLSKDSDKWECGLMVLTSQILTAGRGAIYGAFATYVNRLVEGEVKGIDATPQIRVDIRKGLENAGSVAEEKDRQLAQCSKLAPIWSVFEELREKHPTFILDYCNLKNSRYVEGKLPARLSQSQMADLLGEVTGENILELFKKHGVKPDSSKFFPCY